MLFEYVWQCLLASVVVCWLFDFPGDVWGVSGRFLGGNWGYKTVIHGHWRRLDVFVGYLGSQSLQYEAITLFWQNPEIQKISSPDRIETSKYQNVHI